jgi:hypothetical protein
MTAYDNHSLDIQRANSMVCMMVGADPTHFAQKAKEHGLSEDDQDDCADDYKQTLQSWTEVLAPHLASTPGPAIKVTYERAEDGHLQRFADALKARHILERVAERLRTTYALPAGLSIVARQCDDPNSYYLQDDHQILYCYELTEDIYNLALDNRFGATATAAADSNVPADETAGPTSARSSGSDGGGAPSAPQVSIPSGRGNVAGRPLKRRSTATPGLRRAPAFQRRAGRCDRGPWRRPHCPCGADRAPRRRRPRSRVRI